MEDRNPQPRRERSGGVDAKEEDEEVEMETFFALVRNFKEMRDRRRKELMIDGGETEAAEKKRKKIKTTTTTTWIPRFEREDFDETFQVRGPALVLPKPYNLVKEETTATATAMNKNLVKNGDDCLDLNLAL